MIHKEEFAKRLKEARKRAGLTQEELSEQINVSITTVRRWEWGTRSPRVDELRRIAQKLNIPEEELLYGANDGKIRVTLSYDWDKYEKGEINMSGNDCEVFLGKNGEISLKGAAKFMSRETVEDFIAQVRLQVETAFDAQVKRGAIQSA